MSEEYTIMSENKTYHESINYLASRVNINDYATVSSWLVGFEYYTPSIDNIGFIDSKNKVIHELAESFNIDPKLVLADIKQIIVTRLMYEFKMKATHDVILNKEAKP